MEGLRAREEALSSQIHDITRRLHDMDARSGSYRQLWAERDRLNERMANLSAEIDAAEEDERRNDDPRPSPVLVPFINLRDKLKKRKPSGP